MRAARAGLARCGKHALEQRPQFATLPVGHENIRIGDRGTSHLDIGLRAGNVRQKADDAVGAGRKISSSASCLEQSSPWRPASTSTSGVCPETVTVSASAPIFSDWSSFAVNPAVKRISFNRKVWNPDNSYSTV